MTKTTTAPAPKKRSGNIKPKPVSLPVARKPKAVKLTRAERAELVREKILNAAVEVIGEFGYQNASIGRLAIEAGVAQGTLYLYFDTRQDLFDEVLPHAGQHMMHYIGERIQGAKSFVEVEERGIRAFFAYLQEHPGFYRLLNEAEFAAPIGHKKHFEQLVDHYVASMTRSIEQGILPPYSEDELHVIAYTMMAARSYIYLGYVKYGGSETPPEHVIKTYLELIRASFEK